MKKHSVNYVAAMLANVERRVVDQNALTSAEIMRELNMGRFGVIALCAEKIKSGEWERVYKKNGTQTVPAYRPKKT